MTDKTLSTNEEISARLEIEIELIQSSLLPVESLHSSETAAFPWRFSVKSTDSKYSLRVSIDRLYPDKKAVDVEVKGLDDGREEAEGWKEWVNGIMAEWDEESETPLYTIMTSHFLPLLAKAKSRSPSPQPTQSPSSSLPVPHHALIITHHLLSPTKRKLLIQLSSQLNLVGFSKTGHPGILYATGEKEDILEWLDQVKSWNWLALRVRVACEPIPSQMLEKAVDPAEVQGIAAGTGMKNHVKARGEWLELDKLADCLEWMKKRGRERMLIDAGVGSSRDI